MARLGALADLLPRHMDVSESLFAKGVSLNTILFHRTTREAALAILRDGFRDGAGTYMTDREWLGVWLSNTPFDVNDGASGYTLIEVTVNLGAVALAEWEWIEKGKQRREWLIPAAILNSICCARIVED